MAKGYYLGVDLGGTKIYTALSRFDGKIVSEIKVPTRAFEGYENVIKNIIDTCKHVCGEAQVSLKDVIALGVGSPGPLDAFKGVIHFAPNLQWYNVPLKSILEKTLGIEVFIDKDTNVAAIGEFKYGAGQGVNDMVYITISTGVGGALILNGKLYYGATSGAGEIGHMVVNRDGPLCNCGNKGCLETYSSGVGITRQAVELISRGKGLGMLLAAKGSIENVNAITITSAAMSGDPEAMQIINTASQYLGMAISNLINLLNPELIILGGGLTEIGKPLFTIVHKEIKERTLEPARSCVRIEKALLGMRSGLLGAINLAKEKSMRNKTN